MNLRHVALGVLPVLALAVGAPAAGGQTGGKDTFSFAFTTAKPKKAAGFSVDATFPKQRIIDQLSIGFPRGTKIDTEAVAQCDADAAANATQEGKEVSDVCSSASKIGTGEGTAFIGDAPNPVTFELDVYNARRGAVIDIKLNGKTAFSSPSRFFKGRQDIALSLTKSINARIVAVELDIKRAGTARKPFLRTPASCPSTRKLAATLEVYEADAGSVTAKDTVACARS